jgi:deoxycytidylate deaminase
MPEIHQVGRYTGGNVPPSAANPIFAMWNAANMATNGGAVPDLATICFDHSSRRRAGAGSGASHGTCFAIAEHFDAARGTLMYKFGDSALQLDLAGTYVTTTGRTVNTLRGHAEISALAQAINSVVLPDGRYDVFLTRLYVELSPCPQCATQLTPYIPNTVVMYSYQYGDAAQMDRWVSDNQAGIHEFGGRFRW